MAFATANYFPEFGIAPALGRVLTPDDERPDAEPAAVIGELFWQRRLGGDPAVIGRSIRVNGKLLRVVGVMPRSAAIRDDVWMPLVRQPYVVEGSTLLTDWNSALDLYGRLRPGVSPQASQQETLALAASLRERWPDHVWKGEYLEARPILEFDSNSEEFKIVLTAAALVLLLLVAACANLGTLVLARGVTREREIRVRMALGAGRLRIVRQLFTESLLLAVLSGLVRAAPQHRRPEGDSAAAHVNREPGSGLARARRHVRRRDAGGAGLRAAAGVSARQPGAACGTRQARYSSARRWP